ncbi:leucine-rich repeat domain-containing protein [Treponema sp. OMZ 840]|uniref:leucine-rich repeat domain-containing protein n=1 Tax=Treponema sp. OMZ 840 TaxID=244313 RepID=UPI003D8AEB91
MKRIKPLKGSALTVLFGMAVLCTILCTACPNAAGGGGGNTGGGSSAGPAYVKVPYAELETYLANTALSTKVNYIEVTGIIPADDFKGSGGNTSALGQKIKTHPAKKIALKLPSEVEGLDSMFLCFNGCTNLVSLAGIPSSVTNMSNCFRGCTSLTEAPAIPASVTNMSWCFENCTSLTEAPVIPANVTEMRGCFSSCTSLTKVPDIPSGVTDMSYCFSGCTGLTEIPDIPSSVEDMRWCFSGCTALKRVKLHCDYNPANINGEKAFKGLFKNCTSLEAGGVKVRAAFLGNYTAAEALDVMAVPPVGNPAEQKKKFAKIPIEYVKVSYAELDAYLRDTASSTEINYIEVTGTIQPEDFKGSGGSTLPSVLGQKIKAAAPKKVALKLPATVPGLTDMSRCFYKCENLVSVENIPEGVTSMGSCFFGCTGLAQAPVIPQSVNNITRCFYWCTALKKAPALPKNIKVIDSCFDNCTSLTEAPHIPKNVESVAECFSNCTSLTQAPDIPAGVKDMWRCFDGCISLKRVKLHCNYNPAIINAEKAFLGLFNGCTSLEAGGIKVRAAFYNNYTDAAALNVMAVPPAGNTAEQKKKFSAF